MRLLLTSSLVALRGMNRTLHSPLGFHPEGAVLTETRLQTEKGSDEQVLARQKQMLRARSDYPAWRPWE